MRLTPLDIRQQQFNVKMFRGFDPQEVDAFLEDVAEDYEALFKELALLREQVVTHEERSRGATEAEKALKETLVTTQRLAEEMKEAARREADLITREASLRGEKMLEEVRAEEARIRGDVQNLKRLRQELVEELRATVTRYQRLVATEEAERDAGRKD
ncbi:MAG: DivIVA domain-containing protein [Candidatus Rokubacteria bacterium]|nr:DivIVA domain-containing protein [Candidatus Rokubacteria bacterium]